MAIINRLFIVAGIAACGDLQGFGGPVPPIASFLVTATGDVAAVRPAGDTGRMRLRAALVWGRQWLVEPMCVLPSENSQAQAVISAGCRDPFGFVPALSGADVELTLGTPAVLDVMSRPGSDIMIGDITARVAYGSIVVYDDKNGNETLDLARPDRPNLGGPQDPNDQPTTTSDLVYAASFSTMTAPDQRVAYREGAFVESGFYPRAGCGEPPIGFSVLAAGGFSAVDAIAATLAGTVPLEPIDSCFEGSTSTPFAVELARPAALAEQRCTERINDSSVRFREPLRDPPPDLEQRATACVHSPSFDGSPSDVIEFVITGKPTDSCVGLTHYVLKGCTTSPTCGTPQWDHSQSPPLWWPC